MNKQKVIILGAGLGGLAAAAYLCKWGIKTIVLEKTRFPGGRCYIRNINGYDFNIGALYIGESVKQIIKKYIGLELSAEKFRIGMRIRDKYVTLPFDFQTISELKKCGLSIITIINFISRLWLLFTNTIFDKYKTIGDLFEFLSRKQLIREIGFIIFGVLGANPYKIPSHYFKMGNKTNGPNIGNPVHFRNGNRMIADELYAYITTNGGEVVFDRTVTGFEINKDKVTAVNTVQGIFGGDVFISNIDPKTTFEILMDESKLPAAYLELIRSLERPFQIVSIFIEFKPIINIQPDTAIFFFTNDTIKNFNNLDEGIYNDMPMFILQIPSVFEADRKVDLGTLQFYIPSGNPDSDKIQQSVSWILNEGLRSIHPDLPLSIIRSTVYDPLKYEKEFGFKPYVYGVSPVSGIARLPRRTPFKNLFCAGDSVEPHRPSVPQALLSGFLCAQEILEQINTK